MSQCRPAPRITTEYSRSIREATFRRCRLWYRSPRRTKQQWKCSTALGLWSLGVVLVFELLSGFLAIECPIDRDAISVGSPVPGAGFRPENPDLAERSEEHTSELQSLRHLVCRLL